VGAGVIGTVRGAQYGRRGKQDLGAEPRAEDQRSLGQDMAAR
jgi:hypothetical protein